MSDNHGWKLLGACVDSSHTRAWGVAGWYAGGLSSLDELSDRNRGIGVLYPCWGKKGPFLAQLGVAATTSQQQLAASRQCGKKKGPCFFFSILFFLFSKAGMKRGERINTDLGTKWSFMKRAGRKDERRRLLLGREGGEKRPKLCLLQQPLFLSPFIYADSNFIFIFIFLCNSI